MSSVMVSRSLENRSGSMTRPTYSSALLTIKMPGREPSANSRRVAAIVVDDGTLPTSERIIRSTVRLRSQPTSFALRIVLQFVAKPLAPVAEVGTLVRKLVLEKLKAGEVLEIGVVDPALADTLVGQAV